MGTKYTTLVWSYLRVYFGTMDSLRGQLLIDTFPAASKFRFRFVIRSLRFLIGWIHPRDATPLRSGGKDILAETAAEEMKSKRPFLYLSKPLHGTVGNYGVNKAEHSTFLRVLILINSATLQTFRLVTAGNEASV